MSVYTVTKIEKAAESWQLCFLPFETSSSPHVGVSLNGIFALEDGVSQRFSYREAVASQGDAGLEQVLPRQPAMPLVCHLITADLPGDSYGQSTCYETLL